MTYRNRQNNGFTLIELMVAVTVLVIFTLIALPSFEGVRQRSAIRGAADQVLSFWNQARLEALKRNQMVKVGLVQSGNGAVFCLGAATTTDVADVVPCDCRQATPGSDICDVARFPADNSEWNAVTLSGVTLGGGTLITAMQPAVIDPKRLFLAVPADVGTISLAGPPGRASYRINLSVDRFGRGYLCQSATATDSLSDYANTNRRCSP